MEGCGIREIRSCAEDSGYEKYGDDGSLLDEVRLDSGPGGEGVRILGGVRAVAGGESVNCVAVEEIDAVGVELENVAAGEQSVVAVVVVLAAVAVVGAAVGAAWPLLEEYVVVEDVADARLQDDEYDLWSRYGHCL